MRTINKHTVFFFSCDDVFYNLNPLLHVYNSPFLSKKSFVDLISDQLGPESNMLVHKIDCI